MRCGDRSIFLLYKYTSDFAWAWGLGRKEKEEGELKDTCIEALMTIRTASQPSENPFTVEQYMILPDNSLFLATNPSYSAPQ
jgi:hypothetical protein